MVLNSNGEEGTTPMFFKHHRVFFLSMPKVIILSSIKSKRFTAKGKA